MGMHNVVKTHQSRELPDIPDTIDPFTKPDNPYRLDVSACMRLVPLFYLPAERGLLAIEDTDVAVHPRLERQAFSELHDDMLCPTGKQGGNNL
jgi:hypothetical protein